MSYEITQGEDGLDVHVLLPASVVDDQLKVFCDAISRHYGIAGSTLAEVEELLKDVRSKEEIDEFCRDYITNHAMSEILKAEPDVQPIVTPGIHADGYPEDGKEYEFYLNFLVKPEVTMTSLEPVEITMKQVIVTEEEVEEEMRAHAEEHATFEILEPRPIVEGDFAILDSTMSINGKLVDSFSGPDQRYSITYGSMPNEFIDNVIGMNVGDTKEFTFEEHHKDEYGKVLDEVDVYVFEVTVTELLRKDIPEVTDEWVAEFYPDFKDIAGYRAACRNKLETDKALEQSKLKSQLVLDALTKRMSCNIPDDLYTSIYKSMMDKIWNEVDKRGMTMDEYLKSMKITENELNMNTLMRAGEMIRQNYALEALFDQRNMDLTDQEVEDAISAVARSKGITTAQAALQSQSALRLATESAKRKKALKWLMETAIVHEG